MSKDKKTMGLGDHKRQDPKWGTIEKKDAKGNVIAVLEGLIVGRGDNKQVIIPEDVEKLAKLWCTFNEIADWFSIPVETLKYNFSDIIAKGRAETKQALRKAQLKAAITGNTTMMIWLGKNILGQSDNPINNSEDQILPWLEGSDES